MPQYSPSMNTTAGLLDMRSMPVGAAIALTNASRKIVCPQSLPLARSRKVS